MNKKLKSILKPIGTILTILSFVFIAYAIWKLDFSFPKVEHIGAFLVVLVLGVVIKILTVFITGTNWSRWVWFFAQGEVEKSDKKEAIRVYAKANIGKYLPGNVMHYVERNLFADKMGVAQGMVAASSIVDTISLVIVAVLASLLISYTSFMYAIGNVASVLGDKASIYFCGVLAVIVFGIIVTIMLLRKKMGSILQVYSAKNFGRRLVGSLVLQTIALSMLGEILVLLYAFFVGTEGLSYSNVLISAYIISWVLGFVVVGAPGGIGIREMVLTLLLGPVVGQEMVLSLAIIHRLITIIGDFLTYLIGQFFLNNKEA